VSILDEWIVLDTNVWIFGLRRVPDVPACAQLLERLHRLSVVLPRQILQELQANLSEDEIKTLFRLLSRLSPKVIVNWGKAQQGIITKYQGLGCKLGDAAVAAHLEELGIKLLVSENRDFLEELKELPFRRLSAAQALTEFEQHAS
jgi:predicted nucleic acid-binding protein